MADGITVKLEGIDELKRVMALAPKTIRIKAVRGALRKAGQVISKAAKQNAPVLKTPTKTRNRGTLKRAISVRPSGFARQRGDEGVFIGVRPLRGTRQKTLGKAGAKNPNDPYYWWWQEFGWVATGAKRIRGGKLARERTRNELVSSGKNRKIAGKLFLTNAGKLLPNALKVFQDSVIPQIEKLNKKAGL